MGYKSLFSFLGGVAAGAFIALMLAPDKGSETRRKISEKLKEKGIDLSGAELDEFITMLKERLNINQTGKKEPTTAEEAENIDR